MKRDGYDFLDSVLGPQGVKGPRKPPKHESEVHLAPLWMLHKPANSFEPNFVYEGPSTKKLELETEDITNKDIGTIEEENDFANET